MNRYPKYKPTGIAWLPEVPEGWECVRVGRVYSDVSERGDEALPILSVSISSGVSDRQLDDDELAKKVVRSEDKLLYKHVAAGDLVYNQMRAWQGAFGAVKVEGLVSPAYVVCRPRGEVCSAYIEHFLKTPATVQEMKRQSTGIVDFRLRLYWSQFKAMAIALPPLPTQRAIVAYLDDKCGKIDELVAAKEKEVEFLKELKQTVIADAVTRGVGGGGDRRLVPSGIPWLPQIPEGWEVKRAKYLFRKEQRPVAPGDDIVTCFRNGEVTLRKNRRTSGFTEATDYSHYQHICKGDLVIHQMDAFAGSTGVSDSDGMGTPVLSVCTPRREGVDVYYYARLIRLMGLNGFIQSLYRGIRERSSDFRFETFAKLLLPVPPLDEQRAIVAYIEEKTAKIDQAVAGLMQQVAALKEYKQRLIADVVTGQMRVA